ncbi:hypothetical protein [Paraburkholderia sp. MM6662-R1]|uniref:hypothetical protein n=1 Tax=Paraburkholderia sp. MM6662-R1 TaxID=2991066 RepID=UPI003D227133
MGDDVLRVTDAVDTEAFMREWEAVRALSGEVLALVAEPAVRGEEIREVAQRYRAVLHLIAHSFTGCTGTAETMQALAREALADTPFAGGHRAGGDGGRDER